jgi:hypothetical protein
MRKSIYIKAKRANFVPFVCVCVCVCVLLGDGSGGVSFLVSSRSICLLVTTTMGWYFLWGPFRGGIFFVVRSEGFFGVRSECISNEYRGNAVGA